MTSLRYTLFLLGFVGVLYAVTPSPFAQKYVTATEEELTTAINRLSVTFIEDGRALSAEQRSLESAWLNPELRSEEIDALRKQLFDLEQQLAEARMALREAVEEHPEIKARREKHNAAIDLQRQNRAELQFAQERLNAIRPQRR